MNERSVLDAFERENAFPPHPEFIGRRVGPVRPLTEFAIYPESQSDAVVEATSWITFDINIDGCAGDVPFDLARNMCLVPPNRECFQCVLMPRLAIALLQLVVRRSLEFAERIERFSVESIERRLARTLVRFAGRFGSEAGDGTLTMDAFTHEVLSQYVGTSREIVTHYMSQFRREGYVQYSRRVIALQQRALIEWQTAPPTAASKQSAALAS